MKTFLKRSVNSLTVRRFSSYTYLNLTQFLGALNDNIYKLLIAFFLIQLEGVENSHIILATSGAVFVLPFILFSATSGTLADRFSKRNIIICTKAFEVLIMVSGIFAFQYESKLGLLAILFLLATHSAIFAPSKYGILPELVAHDKITRANGIMTSFTFLAIILGTFIASFILDITDRNFIFAASLCSIFSLVGFLASLCIEYTDPSGSEKRFNVLFVREIIAALKLANEEPSLLSAVFGSAFFLFLGAFVQLNIIPFALQSLHLTDVQGGYLFLLTALGIGSGSMLAGKISGKTVELGIVPLAAFGVAISCFMLDFFSSHLVAVVPLVMILGLFGGMYQIPMDSYIQVMSPSKSRGQIVAATNFLSFIGVLGASTLVFLVGEVFGLAADKGFTIVGVMAILVSIAISWNYFDYLSRLVAYLLSRLHFQMVFFGLKNIPDTPVIYVCHHQAWNETLILLGAQRRRMLFFIEQEQQHGKWMRRLYSLLRVVFMPRAEDQDGPLSMLPAIKKTLSKGISVTLFINHSNVQAEIDKLKQSSDFQMLFQDNEPLLIPVIIEKGNKEKEPQFMPRLRAKLRVPAAVSFG